MSEPLLNILKLCLLVLIYLFFARVLQAVWAEVNGPRPARVRAKAVATSQAEPRKHRRRKSRKTTALRVIEPIASQGKMYKLGDELTVGRAAGCQITLDDTFVSQIHARIFRRDGQLYVEDLGSTNGTYLNRARVTGAVALSIGDHLQVGSVVMELV